jgi:hypothetical protein
MGGKGEIEAVSIPFPGFSWPNIFSSYPLLKSLSHYLGFFAQPGCSPLQACEKCSNFHGIVKKAISG